MYIGSIILLLNWASTIWALTYEPLQPQLRAIADQLIPYTAADRVRVAEEAKKMFNFYVNRDAKISLYGPEIDPLPKIEKLIQDAPGMSDRDFHDAMSRLFKSQRDGHLSYRYPGKQSCFSAYTGLEFDTLNTGQIVVTGIKPGIPNSKDMGPIQVGDSLITFDDQSPTQLYESLKWDLMAGNQYLVMSRLLLFLEFRTGSFFRLPEKDTFQLKLKRHENNEEYTVTLPWLVTTNNNCLKDTDSVMQVNSRNLNWMRRDTASHSLSIFPQLSKTNVAGVPWIATRSRVVFWRRFRFGDFELGLLRITTFSFPAFKDATVDLIAEVLSNQLNGTQGLILDLRDNTGGRVATTASLVQLFKENPVSMTARFKITEETLSLNRSSLLGDNEFVKAFSETPPGQPWSIPFTFPDFNFIQKRSVVYNQPIGILTNAFCFSSCETFTSLMKDNGVATVFGEDPTTGGGGATVIQHRNTLSRDKNMFNQLPFTGTEGLNAKLASQDMSITFCQRTRQNGRLIEDFGVESDFLVPPSIEDILPGGQYIRQMSTIAGVMKQKIQLAAAKK